MKYLIYQSGKFINDKGRYDLLDYAKSFDDIKIGEWLADYFGGTLINEEDSEDVLESYYTAIREEMRLYDDV